MPTHVPNVVEFQVLIDKLKNHNTLAAQRFDEIMDAQSKVLVDQIKSLAEKTKVMSEYAHVVITVIDELAKTTTEGAKAIMEEQEQQSQSQGNILKAVSKIIGQQRQEVASQPIRQLSNELGGQHPRNFQ